MAQVRGSAAPQSLLIAAAGHTCVAWWHAPARERTPGGAPPLAVVLASSWGEEDMSAYDGQRALATRLAEGGLGTLRFEWPDTGDSSADSGAATLADLLAAFDAAATQALALSGCERLAFVGLRLGALLAAHAAVARSDVDAFVALLPVAGGRAFVREQETLDAEPAPPRPPIPGASFDAAELPVTLGGFSQSVRQVEALSVLKWPSAATTAVLEALVLSTADASGRTAADALARMGMRVREWAHADLARAPAVAHEGALAPVAIAEIVRWLRAHAGDASVTRGVAEIEDFGVADAGNARAHAAAAAARLAEATAAVLALSAADAPVWLRLRVAGVAVRERVVQIVSEGAAELPTLVGVLSERDPVVDGAAPGARRAIVLLSCGRARRVGPHRLWVPWARRRAARGDVVLRLDVAGIGDSAPRAGAGPGGATAVHDPRCVDDVERALAWLRREHGVGPCSVIGLGSGAQHAWQAARAGVDVQQVIAINPLTLRRRKDAALDVSAQGLAGNALAARLRHAARLCGRGFARLAHGPRDDDLGTELAHAAARGVALDFVFACREPGLALLREESGRRGAMLERDGLVKVCELAQADRTFAGTVGRMSLYARLDGLLLPVPAMNFAAAAASVRQPAIARA